MNDTYIKLTPDENKLILTHIMERCAESATLWSNKRSPFNAHPEEDNVEFHYFLKSFGSSLVILILPASVDDLKTLRGEDSGTVFV